MRPLAANSARALAHCVAEIPLLVIAALQIAHGWLPTSDDAVIAWRSWDVFSSALPLDGQYSQLSTAGHAVFGLGPLEYFALALPERIDPVHGALWGAALVAAALLAVAVEAAWSAGGAPGAAAVALGAVLITATLPESSVNLVWNPSLGLYAFSTALVLAAVVGAGRLGWLPVGLAAGSLAAQCHVVYAAPAAAALLAASLLGLGRAGPHKRGGVAALSALVLAACWVAPGWQELRGRPGNWDLLFSSLGRHGPAVGFDLGLRGLGAATRLPPSWATRPPPVGTAARFAHFMGVVYGGSEAWGITVLLLCGLVAVVAGLSGRRFLASLAAVSAAAGLAAAWTLGSVAVSQRHFLGYYLYFVLWPVGMAIWATFACSLGAALAAGTRRLRARRLLPRSIGASWALLLALVLATSGGVALALDVPFGSSGLFLLGWGPVRLVAAAVPPASALAEEHGYPARPGPLEVVSSHDLSFVEDAVDEGAGYLLTTRGVTVRLPGEAALPLGPGFAARAGLPALVLAVAPPGSRPQVEVSWRAAEPR